MADATEQARRTWSLGNYVEIGSLLTDAAHHLVDLARIGPEMEVLDIGTGSGSVAVAAARRGAQVTGIDVTDAWYDEARRRAREGGVELDLRLGDATALDLPDDAFHRVVSSFALIFAPDHAAAAREAVRVCRPGGAIAFTAWRPDGLVGRAFGRLAAGLALPDDAPTSGPWGTPEYVRERFEGSGISWAFHPGEIRWRFPSIDDYLDFILANSGPLIGAREALEELGRWDETWADVRAVLIEGVDHDDPAGIGIDQPYQLAVGQLPA